MQSAPFPIPRIEVFAGSYALEGIVLSGYHIGGLHLPGGIVLSNGALQLSARWTELDIDDDTFAFLDPDKSVNHASTWTIGANWFLNKATRLMANYEETYFDGGAANGDDRQTEKVFSTRLQLSF